MERLTSVDGKVLKFLLIIHEGVPQRAANLLNALRNDGIDRSVTNSKWIARVLAQVSKRIYASSALHLQILMDLQSVNR